jgi:hypothetical protein
MYQDKAFNIKTIAPTEVLAVSTVRSYEGGLNVADTDLDMSPKYAKVLDNMERGTDGSLSLRPGTRFFTALAASSTDIINCYYFNQTIISIQADGTMVKTAADKSQTDMRVPGGAKGFTPGVTFVSFTIFNSDLVICNGKDTPQIVVGKPNKPNPTPPPPFVADPMYMQADYLHDLGSLSTTNVPIGLYCATHRQYLCIAGVANEPSTLYISSKGTSGTWPGDTPPNDAIKIDLGPRVSLGSATITGLVSYRDKLLVTFERGVLPMNLGIYTDATPAVHVPTDDGFVEEFGCISHRSLISVGDDAFYTDNIGVNSIARVTVFNTLRPVRVSQLIDPLITSLIMPLTAQQVALHVFSVYDIRHFRYMLFIPVYDTGGNIVETIGFSYTNIPTLNVKAWARLRGWKWQAACRTALQNIFFARENKLYYYDFTPLDGNNADRFGDAAVNSGEGEDVNFTWELPWADFKQRMNVKKMRYIGLDTQGTSKFTCEAYVDNIIQRKGVNVPLLSMTFVGGDSEGYGASPYGDSPYGGGRRSSDERLYAFVAKFKLLKLRFYGSTKQALKFVSISVGYLRGSIRR